MLASNLLFGQRSVPREMAAGAYDLEVRAHDSGQVVLDLPGTTTRCGPGSSPGDLSAILVAPKPRSPR